VPVLVDAVPLDFRLQCLPWNSEFRGSFGRSAYAPTALRESDFDHLHFTICQRSSTLACGFLRWNARRASSSSAARSSA
jgi:hypothetical protein